MFFLIFFGLGIASFLYNIFSFVSTDHIANLNPESNNWY